MEQVPKIVVQRLRAQSKPEVHPDADLLTAFAENSLGERERAPLLEHLAQCADCREIISLAQPQAEMQYAVAAAAPVAAGRAAISVQRRAPVFRWVALAACAVVVAGGAIVLHRESAGRQNLAAKEPVKTVAKAEEKSLDQEQPPMNEAKQNLPVPGPPPPPTPPPSAVSAPQPVAGFGARGQEFEYGLKQKTPAGASIKGSMGMAAKNSAPGLVITPNDVFAKAAKPPESAAAAGNGDRKKETAQLESAPVGSVSETVEVQAAAPPVVTRDEAAIEANQVQLDKSASKDSSTPTAAAQPAAVGGTVPSAQAGEALGGISGRKSAMLYRTIPKAAMPQWSLSADGQAVLRSTDSGRTFEIVPIADKVVFRAISAISSDVWAGGVGGALYHSTNNGLNWQKVVPEIKGKALTADILRIEFTDLEHGKLITSTGETWATRDAGKSWQKQ